MKTDEEYAKYLADLMAEGIQEGVDHYQSLLKMTTLPDVALQQADPQMWQQLARENPSAIIGRLKGANHN